MPTLPPALKSLSLRKLRRTNAIKVFLTSALLWLIAYTFCRLRFWRDPHSAFFNDRYVYEWRYSLYREREGRRLITTPKHVDNNHPWVYLRLFFTETALSWTSADFAYRNMGWIFIGASLSLLAALMAVRRAYPSSHAYLDYPSVGVISFVSLPALIGLVFMVGKYSLMSLSGVVETNAHGCCTQGLVFPRDQVDALIAHLTEVKAGQTDSIIEEYADAKGLTRYALAPQQLQHVGLKSSRDNLEINTRSTWAFWFEENKPADLRKEHEDLLRDVDVAQLLDGHS